MKIHKSIIIAVMLVLMSVPAYSANLTNGNTSGQWSMTFTLNPFATVKAAPAAVANLEYDGTAQALVTSGDAEGGTMVYALGTSEAASEDYTASIPTAIDEGIYYVWYKVSGDSTHRSSLSEDVVSVDINLTTYTITYDMNGGGDNHSGNPSGYTLKSGNIRLSAPVSSRAGYGFSGWLLSGDESFALSTDVTVQTSRRENYTYIAQWNILTYSLTYSLNGGSVSPDNPASYDVETETFTLNNPVRTSYIFGGWTGTSLNAATATVTVAKGSTGDRAYSAVWSAEVYTISYDLQGGTVSPDNPAGYTIESDDFTLTQPTRNGYSFAGWTGTDLTGASTDVTISAGSTGNREYSAVWSVDVYTISYDLQGGTISPDNPASYDVETETFTLNNPVKTGYIFGGWTGTDLTEASTDVTIPAGSTGNREYSAVWSVDVYTISYDLQGGTVSPDNPVSYTIESGDFTLSNPTRTGYTFDGWSGTSITGTSQTVTIAGHSTGNRSYTANWSLIQYEISFDLGGGTFSGDAQTTYNYETDTFTLNIPEKEGYTFTGWSTEGSVELLQNVEIPQGSTDNRKYTANWTVIVYTISYDLDGGTISPDNPAGYTIESDDFTLTQPTRECYSFAGWTGTDLTEASTDVTIPAGSTGNREYSAVWSADVYTISYDLQGGEVSPDNPASYDVETETFTLDNPVKTGYIFGGWTGTSLDAAAATVTVAKGSTGNREYSAVWSVDVYTISYDLDGGTISPDNPVSYTIESSDFTLTQPTRECYSFAGWTGTDLTGASTDVTISAGSTGNREYSAVWSADVYTISYDLQGGTVSPDNPAGYTIESSDFTLTQPTRECYSFAGWTGTDLTEASTDVTILAGSTGNREYSAVWSVDVYTITYTLNNGSVTGNPDKYTVESGAITLNNPQRDGYQFDGWTGTGLTGKTQTVTIAQGSTGNREYTANFSPIQYTISYELNGGTASNPASYTIESGDITLSNPTRTGYTFDGWSGTGITGTSQTVTIAGHSTGNRSYTANWSLIQYGISYDLGGGTFSEDAQTTYNYETDTFTLNIPEREGYTFTGWSTEGRDELLQNVEIPQGSTDNRKYTAHWTAIIYTISYDLDGGTVSPDNPVSYDIESEDITLNNPTKDGYTFTGWTGTDIETASIDVIIPQGSTGNREYTATWSEDITPDSPDITPESPDIKPESPDIQPDSPDIKPTSPDITPTSPDVTPSTPAVLQTISVDISGSNTLITDVEHGASLTLTADISGNYSDGRTETLSPDSYTLTWGTDNTAEAISFSNGTLRVEQNAVVGAYEVNVTATAESGSIKGTSGRTVRVTVNNVIPELTMQTGSLTVKRGRRITNITVRAERGTQNLTWTTNGTLPEGLTGSANGETYVISGTVAGTAEIRDYPYVIKAANEAGEAEKNITITVSEAESVSGETIEIIPDEIAVMTDEELQEMVEGMTEIALTGKVENLSEVITRLETVTEIKTLDLSLVEGVEEVKLDETNKVETLTLTGNQSIQKVEVTGNTSLKSLNMAGSVIETVDAKWCENLTEVNLEGCENLSYLDVSETAITELNVADCKNLETLNCASCDISALNLEGCESLTDIDCQNNSLLILNASQFSNLNSLECRNQQVGNKPLARVFSFLDLLFGRGIFAASAGDDEVLENVSNLKVYDEAGNELTAELDDSGELSVNGDPAKITYDYDTGFNGVMMDVTVFAAETPDEETHEETAPVYGGGPGDPRGGCDSGFRVVAALMLLFTALTRKR